MSVCFCVCRYISEGKEKAVADINEDVEQIETEYRRFEKEKDKLAADFSSAQEGIAKQQMRVRELEDNIQLFKAEKEIKETDAKISDLRKELGKYGSSSNLGNSRAELQDKLDDMRKNKASYEGRLKGFEDEQRRMQRELRSEMFAGADDKYRKKMIEVKTTELANQDLDTYYKALDRAIMRFHGLKMAEINGIIKEYWIHTYKGHGQHVLLQCICYNLYHEII